MNFDLKNFLKKIKLNEESISMVLGAIVIVIVGILIVNYFKDKSAGTIPVSSTQTSTKEHVVVKGETLWSIAEDSFGSGYNWVDIKSANSLKTENIEVGQKLILPDVSPKQPTSTKKVAAVVSTEPIAVSTYTVVKGDSLWKIAVRAYGDGYKWVSIAKANKLANPGIIHSGNVLTLPR
ncbi:MAG TPA: LysM peptidoglycan-binding domain-containing protein [Candidatus Saccharimonadales bacterium]|nr:LysM peptidoglycan-binding domain-containing protein [Candidatus Saccharimonadales bacterium]